MRSRGDESYKPYFDVRSEWQRPAEDPEGEPKRMVLFALGWWPAAPFTLTRLAPDGSMEVYPPRDSVAHLYPKRDEVEG